MPFEVLIANLKHELGQEKVDLAYMEFCSPSIEDVVFQSYKDGYTELDFLPLFMAGGAHLRNDVPRIFEKLKDGKRDLRLNLLSPIGEHELITNAILGIVKEKLSEAHKHSLQYNTNSFEDISLG
jgi:sirohydrochlorin cobaltochelatase